MTPECQRCSVCAARYFPSRHRCHHCGSTEFVAEPMQLGEVRAFTRVHRAPQGWSHVFLVEVAVQDGLRVLAVADFQPQPGATVALARDAAGAIFAQAQSCL
jgi:uncharacterized OB-fold protein